MGSSTSIAAPARRPSGLPPNQALALVLVHWRDLRPLRRQGLGIPAVISTRWLVPAEADHAGRDNYDGSPTKPKATPGKPEGKAPMCLREARRVDDCPRTARRADDCLRAARRVDDWRGVPPRGATSRAEAAVRAARRRRHLQAVLAK